MKHFLHCLHVHYRLFRLRAWQWDRDYGLEDRAW